MYNRHNYYMGTKAYFDQCEAPNREEDYVSSSGSTYWYTDDGVYRMSDHWGYEVASCDWFLDGDEISSYADFHGWRTGFCKWCDFKQNHNYEVCVYGVPDEFANSYDALDNPYKSYDITPDMLCDGMVITEFGECKFEWLYFMYIKV